MGVLFNESDTFLGLLFFVKMFLGIFLFGFYSLVEKLFGFCGVGVWFRLYRYVATYSFLKIWVWMGCNMGFVCVYLKLSFSSRLFFSSTASRIHSDGLLTVLRYFSWSVVKRTP